MGFEPQIFDENMFTIFSIQINAQKMFLSYFGLINGRMRVFDKEYPVIAIFYTNNKIYFSITTRLNKACPKLKEFRL